MPKRDDLKKVMVIGSGPIIIGQAAEFDYAGTQACKALREEGISVVLINSNPATIMTDVEVADKVYIEPINVEFATRIIERERPDGLLPTLGGQTGLNLAVELANAGVLEKYNVELLGTPLQAIHGRRGPRAFQNAHARYRRARAGKLDRRDAASSSRRSSTPTRPGRSSSGLPTLSAAQAAGWRTIPKSCWKSARAASSSRSRARY